MKIKYRNDDRYIESHISNLNDLKGLNLKRGYIAFLIPYSNNLEVVKNINNNVISKNIKLKAKDNAVELICSYADIDELERDLMGYQRALELYIEDLELNKDINSKLRRKIMWLYLNINSRIINLLIKEWCYGRRKRI